jgi:hypothetical protein
MISGIVDVGYKTWQNVDAGNCMNLELDGKMDVLHGEKEVMYILIQYVALQVTEPCWT